MKKLLAIGIVLAAMVTGIKAQSPTNTTLLGDLNLFAKDVVDSPWGIGLGYGRATTGDYSLVYAIVTDQLVTNIAGTGFSSGPIAGYEELWAPHLKQIDSLSGGWQFSDTGKPLSFIGKTFLTNVTDTVMAYQLVSTPRVSTAPIGAISGVAATIDFYPQGIYGFHAKALGGYENRAGQGVFDRQWLFIGAALTHEF